MRREVIHAGRRLTVCLARAFASVDGSERLCAAALQTVTAKRPPGEADEWSAEPSGRGDAAALPSYGDPALRFDPIQQACRQWVERWSEEPAPAMAAVTSSCGCNRSCSVA
ncbi:MAG: hypothetical protein H0V12_05060 [Chloroflexi bacterium]|nr:hypothetical protein [Chloroflexota bacterium]